MHEGNDFDRVIDEALGAYGVADSGLERRALARIAAEHAPVPWRGRSLWAAFLAAAACLLIAMVLMHGRPASAPQANRIGPPAPHEVPKETARVESPATQRVGRLRRVARPARTAGEPAAAALPKLEVFPTPRPLSPAERVLVEFAAHAPAPERRSFLAAQTQAGAPIHLAEIRINSLHISPLQSSHLGTN